MEILVYWYVNIIQNKKIYKNMEITCLVNENKSKYGCDLPKK